MHLPFDKQNITTTYVFSIRQRQHLFGMSDPLLARRRSCHHQKTKIYKRSSVGVENLETFRDFDGSTMQPQASRAGPYPLPPPGHAVRHKLLSV